ncbi:type II toxin-antitoxin system VapC family toxin [Nocardia sp. NPDC051832]|uniref:type II toxin-antitoxin system VapC family toxin n=1 Tax=Nocardia sp. NPDC051832 TaxID=3155673 RepID=UPI0034185D69
MRYLLDTNVLSELCKQRPKKSVPDWVGRTAQDERWISVITVGEMRRGITLLRNRKDFDQAVRIEQKVAELESFFSDRILPVTIDVARSWAELSPRQPMATCDSWIAATALNHGLTIVTGNTKDFESSGVPTVNPFE